MHKNELEELGEAAYEAFHVLIAGRPCIPWGDAFAATREGWMKVANAVMEKAAEQSERVPA